MNLIAAAILAALAVGVTNGVTGVSKKVVPTACRALKSVLQRKYGKESQIIKARTAKDFLQKVNLQPNGPPTITRRYYDDFQLSYLSDF